MNKLKLIIAFFIFCFYCYHNLSAQINEKIRTVSFDTTLNFLPYPQTTLYEHIDESKTGSPILRKAAYFFALPPQSKMEVNLSEQKYLTKHIPGIDINPNVILKNDSIMIYQEVELSKDNFYESDIYPSDEFVINGYTWIRDIYCAVITINIDRYNWRNKNVSSLLSAKLRIKYDESFGDFKIANENKYDSIVKKLIINYNYAKQYSIPKEIQSDDSLSKWIDYSQSYVKLKIPQDGIYRIYYNDLKEYGIETFINSRKLKLYNKGRQIPIYVNDGGDDSFDEQDYVEFYCEKNYGSKNYREIVPIKNDYLNYFDRYNDTTFVWLSWEGENGDRVNIVKENNKTASDTLNYGLIKLHLEDDKRLWYYDPTEPRVQLPFWQENKVWTWIVVGNSGSQSIYFWADHHVPNKKVNTVIRLISNAADKQQSAHKVGVSLNSLSIQDTIVYDYKKTINFFSEFNSNNLIEGNNTIRIFGMTSNAGFHQSLVDWIDVDYYRYNYAVDDSILIMIDDSLEKKEKIILVQNIAENPSNLVVYKIKPVIKKIENFILASQTILNKETNVLTFSDTVSKGDTYLIIKAKKVLKPIFDRQKKFENLRKNTRGADYIIISSKELKSSAREYQKFISEKYKLRTELVFVDDIYDEFSFGYPWAESIREFLKYAFYNWTLPKPSYLLLIGDANYDYKNKFTPVPMPRKKNLVPSFGFPVSDSWFVIWDNEFPIPQMFVGRIPAENNQQVLFYLDKHMIYLNRDYDIWNKTFLFFSGGDASNISQLNQIKEVNDSLYNVFINTPPIGGVGKHFYKTAEPKSNYGPYSQEEIQNAIDEGGIIISYVGHSGTQTWDNGITKVEDIKNKYPNRFSLISDFGCSTGKFAEPDINSFAEEFINQNSNGQAIIYLGNSSWGYLSTSARFPLLFYKNFIKDSLLSVGQIHWLAKLEQYEKYGLNDVNKVFTYCNNLFGDPIINLKIPPKPNLFINDKLISTEETFLNDSKDSLKVKIKFFNAGRIELQKVKIMIEHYYADNLIEKKYVDELIPTYEKSIEIFVLNKAGRHELKCVLDYPNEIDEINENDNAAVYSFNVNSLSLKPLLGDNFYNGNLDVIKFLNPVIKSNTEKINLSFSFSQNFQNHFDYAKDLDTLITSFLIPEQFKHKRTWFRMKLTNTENWSETFSFKSNSFNAKWYIDTLLSHENEMKYVQYDSLMEGWHLTNSKNKLKIISAGQSAGSFASVQFNNIEKLPNTYFWGIAAAIIDSITLEPLSAKYFLYPANTSGIELKNFIDSLKDGTLVALSICDDGAQSVLGFSSGTQVRKAIETLGSKYIDSVRYRESWCILGKKGAKIGSVPESYKKLFEGQAVVELQKEVAADSGYFLTPSIKNISAVEKIFCNADVPKNTELKIFPLGISDNNKVDTLAELSFIDKTASLINFEEWKYPSLKLLNKIYADKNKNSPLLKSIGINYKLLPELAVNYQVVSLNKDTLEQGEEIKLSFYIYNVGETTTKNFNVVINLIDNKNNTVKVLKENIDSIKSNDRIKINFQYNTSKLYGDNKFEIMIDPENKIKELYEDNNFYSISFYVKQNTQPQTISVYFDGVDIIDGDYVSARPEIKIELYDPSYLRIDDTTALQIFLNDELISYSNNTDKLQYSFNDANPKMVVYFLPILKNGEHVLKVIAAKSHTTENIKTQLIKRFLVENETKLINVYNFPNPFSTETYFTFKLTQIPDELRIKIFTVAGRLIKEIKVTSHELNYDFNRVYWDGRDEDGNLISNGIYLYKVILKRGSETVNATQKLAIVR